MEDSFTIMLPASASEAEVEALEQALKQIDAVADAGALSTRGLDPASIGVWVQVATSVLGVVGIAVPLIQKIVETIRGKGVTGAKIKLPNGAEIAVDNATTGEIERILQASRKK